MEDYRFLHDIYATHSSESSLNTDPLAYTILYLEPNDKKRVEIAYKLKSRFSNQIFCFSSPVECIEQSEFLVWSLQDSENGLIFLLPEALSGLEECKRIQALLGGYSKKLEQIFLPENSTYNIDNLLEGLSPYLIPITSNPNEIDWELEQVFTKGEGRDVQKISTQLENLGNLTTPLCISGSLGVGKKTLSQLIYKRSKWGNGPFYEINCEAISHEILIAEIFGTRSGNCEIKGKLESAHGGVLLLRNLAKIPKSVQSSLLKVLKGSETRKPETLIIFTSITSLNLLLSKGMITSELFDLLKENELKIPCLNERKDDLPDLISKLARSYGTQKAGRPLEFTPEALELLCNYSWPGNLQELENLIERMTLISHGNKIDFSDLPEKFVARKPPQRTIDEVQIELPEGGLDLKRLLAEIENSLILEALRRTNGNKNQAAKLLHLNRTTLIEKLKKKELKL